MNSGFAVGEGQWRARQGTLRQVVRQELVTRQLAAHIPDTPPRRVLDVGCGQGTQLLRLARRGHDVTGLDSSATLLDDLAASLETETPEVQQRVRLVCADAEDLQSVFAPWSFDVVLCHGVFMYLSDPAPMLADLARVVTADGIVSLLVRNGDALAMRPGLLGDWKSTQELFEGLYYDNRISVTARADRLDDITAGLADHGLVVKAWYGVRVFTDIAPVDAVVPPEPDLAAVLACEERAGTTEPYRRVAALTHLIAGRT